VSSTLMSASLPDLMRDAVLSASNKCLLGVTADSSDAMRQGDEQKRAARLHRWEVAWNIINRIPLQTFWANNHNMQCLASIVSCKWVLQTKS